MNTPFVFLNGDYISAAEASISVFDHGFLYGDGVYETLRTVNGAIFDIRNHYNRLQNSAQLLHLTLPYSFEEIKACTETLLEKNNFSAENPARIRWTLTRGNNDFYFSDSKTPTFLIATSALQPYPEEYLQNGVAVSTLAVHRILPEAKSTSLLPMILGKQKAEAEECFECLFLEDGSITEGTVSNFFLFETKTNTLISAPAEKILPGTAAKILRTKAKNLDMKTVERDFTTAEALEIADEAFLTNSLFGIMPVTQIDRLKVGDGMVGAVFQQLFSDFWNTETKNHSHVNHLSAYVENEILQSEAEIAINKKNTFDSPESFIKNLRDKNQ